MIASYNERVEAKQARTGRLLLSFAASEQLSENSSHCDAKGKVALFDSENAESWLFHHRRVVQVVVFVVQNCAT